VTRRNGAIWELPRVILEQTFYPSAYCIYTDKLSGGFFNIIVNTIVLYLKLIDQNLNKG
jgi:hypothetical protein